MADDRTDEALMLAVKTGDQVAFAALYGRHKDGVLNFCYQMLRNYEDAADVFQEAFRYLFGHAATYQPTAKFTTYLYHIARNLCIDILRKRRRWNLRQLEPDYDVPDETPAGNSRLEDEEIEANLKRAMEEVPEPYREVVLLRVTQGLAYEEIAKMTDSPLGTVKSRLHTGFELLRQVLKRKKMIE
jgi:RNA polymerase sigma-70 factor (ECF subfamily)